MTLHVVAVGRACQLQPVPHAVSVRTATNFVPKILVGALATADRNGPLALWVRGNTGRGVLQVARLGATAGIGVPEASGVLVAIHLCGVSVEALVIAASQG